MWLDNVFGSENVKKKKKSENADILPSFHPIHLLQLLNPLQPAFHWGPENTCAVRALLGCPLAEPVSLDLPLQEGLVTDIPLRTTARWAHGMGAAGGLCAMSHAVQVSAAWVIRSIQATT